MITPKDEAELADAVSAATGSLAIRGGGTRSLGHPVDGEALSTAELTGITLYEPGALTIVARAGTPVREVEAALAAEGQRLPFEPMDHRGLMKTKNEPTIGGVVAANVSGPRRIQAGACRDSLIGVRFVDGDGHVVKNGGRVMKNVTGYDLVKLMAGSYGTLGVLSEVSFKVLPAAETQATLVLDDLAIEDAVSAMTKALGSPYEITGAARSVERATFLRIEGFSDSVKYRSGKLVDLLSEFGTPRIEAQMDWSDLRDASALADEDAVWRLSVKPTDGPAVVNALSGARVQLDWGGGLIWVGASADIDVRSALTGIPGHATLVKASDEAKRRHGVFHPEPTPIAKISEGLRQQFDPKGILNPGLMG